MNWHRSSLVLCVACIGIFTCCSSALAQQYTITGISAPQGFSAIFAAAINASGQVAGTIGGSADHAFLYSGGVVTDIGATWGSNPSGGTSLNASGHVAGYYWTGTTNHAFTYKNGSATDLGVLSNQGTYSYAYGINDSDQVTGFASYAQGTMWHAFVYSNGTMADIFPGSQYSKGYAINNAGTVVGNAGSGSYSQAYNAVPANNVGDFWSYASTANAISNSGNVAGNYGPNGSMHAFLFSNNVLTNLGTLGGAASYGNGVNDAGVVVGQSNFAAHNNAMDAFVYLNGTMYDLNTLIPANSGWTLADATGINELGQIVGYGTNPSGQEESFILTPTPEPGSVGVIAFAGIAMLRRRRVTSR